MSSRAESQGLRNKRQYLARCERLSRRLLGCSSSFLISCVDLALWTAVHLATPGAKIILQSCTCTMQLEACTVLMQHLFFLYFFIYLDAAPGFGVEKSYNQINH
jgi:hypothetical protein